MLTIGITGGIGAGKSTIVKIFEQLGIPVYKADETARKLTNTNKHIISEIKKLFGGSIYLSDGNLDRKRVSEIVFSNPSILDKLNQIIHPVVFKDFDDWIKIQRAPFVLKEAAILFESGSDKGLDKIITVSAPKALRIERVVKRDGISKEEIEKRLKNQWTEEKRIENSNYVVYNDDIQLVIPQVLKIFKELSK